MLVCVAWPVGNASGTVYGAEKEALPFPRSVSTLHQQGRVLRLAIGGRCAQGARMRAEEALTGLERELLWRARLAIGGRCAQGARMRAEEALTGLDGSFCGAHT